uniref:Uncharacterized protein n=1 Tax=Panagrolaimus davidi TaxID=227884 RepID=A0A914Q652_9BILA
MTQRYKAYFTVPTGRQSPPSAANSSASDIPVLSKSSKRQQPSSYVSIQHPQGRVNPFKFSLNLVVNVQPMDNNEQQRWNGNVTSIATPSDVSAAQSDSRSSQDSSKSNMEILKMVKATGSRSSHDSSKSKTPTNRRYKNKQSLLPFSSLNKSRNKSLGTSLNDTLLPRRLSFNESDENEEVFDGESTDFRPSHASLKDKRKFQTTGNRRCKYKKSFLNKPRSKSTGTVLPGFQPYPRPRRLSFNESDRSNDVSEYETMRSDADKQLVEVGAVAAKSSLSHTSQDSFNAKNGAVTYANTRVPLESKAPIYNHQRQFRVGFIMNGVQTAVNCMVNIRSNDENLYVEPVELLYEGEKMWRRPVRQVTKEMEEKIAADKKKQMK